MALDPSCLDDFMYRRQDMGVPNSTREVHSSRVGVVSGYGSVSAVALPLQDRKHCNADSARGDGISNGMRPETELVRDSVTGACSGES